MIYLLPSYYSSLSKDLRRYTYVVLYYFGVDVSYKGNSRLNAQSNEILRKRTKLNSIIISTLSVMFDFVSLSSLSDVKHQDSVFTKKIREHLLHTNLRRKREI